VDVLYLKSSADLKEGGGFSEFEHISGNAGKSFVSRSIKCRKYVFAAAPHKVLSVNPEEVIYTFPRE
jgi:hypothetical protein